MSIESIIFRISKLNYDEKKHILKILKLNNVTFTKNSNGYFFNLFDLDNAVIKKLNNCLETIENNRHIIEDLDKRREKLLIYYKSLIEERLIETISNIKKTYINKLRIVDVSTNIKCIINRKYRIKKRNLIADDADHELLMTEYKRADKYNKSSVYWRLLKAVKIKNERYVEMEDGDYYAMDNNTYNSNNQDVVDIDVEADIDLDIENIDDINDIDDIGDIDDIDEPGEIELDGYHELEEDNPEYNEDYQEEIDDEIDIDEALEEELFDNTTKQIIDKDILFFKRLLNKQGFVFDENAKCLLEYQEYIN